jgi:hypothetical protein
LYIDPAFEQALASLDLPSIDASPDTIYVVDPELRLRAYNDAWVRFARDNGAEGLLGSYGLGEPIVRAFPEPVRRYYRDAYREVLARTSRFEQIYECSSAEQVRRFHQTAYPLPGGRGLVIAHHLVVELARVEDARSVGRLEVRSGQLITQCCHCRTVCDPANPERWVWVPDLVRKPARNISHGLCPRCFDFYYPVSDRE